MGRFAAPSATIGMALFVISLVVLAVYYIVIGLGAIFLYVGLLLLGLGIILISFSGHRYVKEHPELFPEADEVRQIIPERASNDEEEIKE